jgi:ATP-dependent DNA ligase
MLANARPALPDGDGWLFEPKWDGFRCIAFADTETDTDMGADTGAGRARVTLTSRNERPFDRYFPEVAAALAATLPPRCVVDGELVVPAPGGGLDFDALLQRIHPAESRVRLLAESTPAVFLAFDLLALGDRSLLDVPLAERRALLETHVGVRSPATTDRTVAADWFHAFEGAGLDGVVAKRLDGTYRPGERAWVKVKHERTADCVVAGFRVHKDGNGVGSLLLGLYDDRGVLNHVGVAASFTAKERRALLAALAPLTDGALADHPWRDWAEASARAAEGAGRMPGAPSRWNATKDLSWTPVRVERVVEVRFSQLEGGRFRHNAHVVRWRPDRDAASCRYDQLELTTKVDLRRLVQP